jgi:hypothetical protein
MADRRGRRSRSQRPARGQDHSPEQQEPYEEQWAPYDWDEVVDVVCVGSVVTATAAAVASARAGLSVRLVNLPDSLDAPTQEYLDSVTDDLGDPPTESVDPELPVRTVSAEAGPDRSGSVVPTFSGAALRNWAARCVSAPGGVLSTAVALGDAVVVGEVTFDAEPPPLADWIEDRAHELDVPDQAGTLTSLVFDDGRVAGAILDTPRGTLAVRATHGVVIALDGPEPRWPTTGVDAGTTARLAFATMSASRFARLEILVPQA